MPTAAANRGQMATRTRAAHSTSAVPAVRAVSRAIRRLAGWLRRLFRRQPAIAVQALPPRYFRRHWAAGLGKTRRAAKARAKIIRLAEEKGVR
jgi:hypothetical protein